jgi:hypothetical protein
MGLAALCALHTPLMRDGSIEAGTKDAVAASLSRADNFTANDIRERGGRGGQKLRARLAAEAVFSPSRPDHSTLDFYEAVPAWIAGIAIFTAETAASQAS